MIAFDGSFESDHSRETLWTYFTDPDVLAQCAPGCDEIVLETPAELSATVSVGVGSVRPTFDVEMEITEARHPERLVMQAGGDANRNSFETTAEMDLQDDGDGTTTVEWRAETNVSGLIASMGQRALDSVASRLVNNFFDDLETLAAEGVPAESTLRSTADVEAAADD